MNFIQVSKCTKTLLLIFSLVFLFSSPLMAHHDPDFPYDGEQCDDDDPDTEDPEDPADASLCNAECHSRMIRGFMPQNSVCCYTGWMINSGDVHAKRPQWDARSRRQKLEGTPIIYSSFRRIL